MSDISEYSNSEIARMNYKIEGLFLRIDDLEKYLKHIKEKIEQEGNNGK